MIIDQLLVINPEHDSTFYIKEKSLAESENYDEAQIYFDKAQELDSITEDEIVLANIFKDGFFINSGQILMNKVEFTIPQWIKNNAAWWTDGHVRDSIFTNGIQYMIKENIISIPDLPEQASETTKDVPDWVRNNAGWWADGLLSDDDFVSGIKYLVEQGIIKV